MGPRKARVTIVILSCLIAYVSLNSLARGLKPDAFIWCEEDKEDASWIASSPSWVDRKVCRWLGICGAAHFRLTGPRFGHQGPGEKQPEEERAPWRTFWTSSSEDPDQWDEAERARRQIPDYVFEHAPLVHLFSGEHFWPGDIAEHLYHTTRMLNYTPIQSESTPATLSNLDGLNKFEDGMHVFLTSNDNVEDHPLWLEAEANIPGRGEDEDKEASEEDNGEIDEEIFRHGVQADLITRRGIQYYLHDFEIDKDSDEMLSSIQPLLLTDDEKDREELRRLYGGKKIQGSGKAAGYSDAPAILVVTDKGNGIVDAFWFYFYSFNLGNAVLNVRFGNHVGDWEHCLVRFHNGKPKALFLSAHSGGDAYTYETVEKIGQRPVIYSATGSHAMYATPGIHPYILPLGLLHDETDRGPLWDPLLNVHSFVYDYREETFLASTASPQAPTAWLYFNGRWGDKFYPLSDPRQYRLAGQYHYVNGPLGPHFKRLDRRHICQGADEEPCVIKSWIGGKNRVKRFSPASDADVDDEP